MLKDFINYIKNNFLNIFIIIILYQIILTLITFNKDNFQVLSILLALLAALVFIDKNRNF